MLVLHGGVGGHWRRRAGHGRGAGDHWVSVVGHDCVLLLGAVLLLLLLLLLGVHEGLLGVGGAVLEAGEVVLHGVWQVPHAGHVEELVEVVVRGGGHVLVGSIPRGRRGHHGGGRALDVGR